jgi:hypothetical protein
MPSDRRVLRCTVYTRKSSEHGLEQDFRPIADISDRFLLRRTVL